MFGLPETVMSPQLSVEPTLNTGTPSANTVGLAVTVTAAACLGPEG